MKRLFLAIALLPFISAFSENVAGDSLKSIPLQEVEVVSVRATTQTPVAYSNLGKEKIESANFGQDIPFLLLLTPSVITTSDAGTGIGYTGFRIRGTDANRINVTINGIPLNDSESQGVYWVDLPDFASSLEDLQVQRGVGTSTNGAGAFGASINMKTSTMPLQPYGELSGGYGSFNTSKATFKTGSGVIDGHWAFDARLSSIRSDGFIDRASVGLNSYFAQGAYFNERTMIKFITFGGKEKTYHAWDGVPDYILFPSDLSPQGAGRGNRTYNPSGYMGDDANGNPQYYPNQTDNYEQTHYQLSLLQILNTDLKLNAALHYTRGFGYYEEYKIDQPLIEYGLKPYSYVIAKAISQSNPVSINGIDYLTPSVMMETGTFDSTVETVENSNLVRRQYLDNYFGGLVFSLDYTKNKGTFSLGGSANRYYGNHFGEVLYLCPSPSPQEEGNISPLFISPSPNGNGSGEKSEYYRNKGDKSDANIYVKGNYQLAKNLSVYGDLQYRFIDYMIDGIGENWDWLAGEMQQLNVHEKFHFFNPKAGLHYEMNPQNVLYGSVAVAHREPNRNNYTDGGTTEIPKPERLTDYELGYRFNHKTWAFSANFYYMKYKDQLVLTGRVNAIGEPLTSNVPDSYRTGIELIAGMRLFPCLDWNGNLTLSRNKIKNYTEYVTVYDSDGNSEEKQQADYYGTTNISFSPDVIANSLFTFKYRSFTAGLQSNYVGKQYLDNTGRTDANQIQTSKRERSIDAYFVNNLRLSYDFPWRKGGKQWSVRLSINNLFNEQYESNGWVWSCYYRQADGSLEPYTEKSYFPQAGINVMTNIALRF